MPVIVVVVAFTCIVGQGPVNPIGPVIPVIGMFISMSGQSYIGGGGSGSVQLDIKSKLDIASVKGRPHLLLANISAIKDTPSLYRVKTQVTG